MPVLHPRPFFYFFLQNLIFIYVSAIYFLVSILFLGYFELSIWKGKKRNRHGVTKLVLFMFFYEHHFFHIFARTRLLGTKVDATDWKNLKSLKPIAYYETWRKGFFKPGMTFYPAIWSHPKRCKKKKVSRLSRQLFLIFFRKYETNLAVLACECTFFNNVRLKNMI